MECGSDGKHAQHGHILLTLLFVDAHDVACLELLASSLISKEFHFYKVF